MSDETKPQADWDRSAFDQEAEETSPNLASQEPSTSTGKSDDVDEQKSQALIQQLLAEDAQQQSDNEDQQQELEEQKQTTPEATASYQELVLAQIEHDKKVLKLKQREQVAEQEQLEQLRKMEQKDNQVLKQQPTQSRAPPQQPVQNKKWGNWGQLNSGFKNLVEKTKTNFQKGLDNLVEVLDGNEYRQTKVSEPKRTRPKQQDMSDSDQDESDDEDLTADEVQLKLAIGESLRVSQQMKQALPAEPSDNDTIYQCVVFGYAQAEGQHPQLMGRDMLQVHRCLEPNKINLLDEEFKDDQIADGDSYDEEEKVEADQQEQQRVSQNNVYGLLNNSQQGSQPKKGNFIKQAESFFDKFKI